ncbi:uncharacterized protein LOC121800861 [Salvia splendens]|uniref:uncharacterized protein LOC121800861 n=1 Tax=Salvia splendens TaxID=180675 RepID=UPI001C25EAA9|nr:uncharacterized protein LOC121800861 [Salvia splendens]
MNHDLSKVVKEEFPPLSKDNLRSGKGKETFRGAGGKEMPRMGENQNKEKSSKNNGGPIPNADDGPNSWGKQPVSFEPEKMRKMGVQGECSGLPSIHFSSEKTSYLAEKMGHAIVGKFSHSISSSQHIQNAFIGMRFKGEFSWKYINAKHVLIQFSLLEDYVKLLGGANGMPVWFVERHHMRVFKWTPDFDPFFESPIAAVWCNLIGLPIHLFEKLALFAIGGLLGEPLQVDHVTISRTRLSFARMCIKIDISQTQTQEIVLDFQGREIRQIVKWDRIPQYCYDCKHFGHSSEVCYANGKREKLAKRTYNFQKSKEVPQEEMGGKGGEKVLGVLTNELVPRDEEMSVAQDGGEGVGFGSGKDKGLLVEEVHELGGGEFLRPGRRRGKQGKGAGDAVGLRGISIDPSGSSGGKFEKGFSSRGRYRKMLPNGDFDPDVYEDEGDWYPEEDPDHDNEMEQDRLLDKRGQIWIFAAEGFEVDGWDDSKQVLHARFETPLLPAPFFVSVVYGKCFREGRLEMWDKLREIAASLDGGETRGCEEEKERMLDFAEAISDCQLLDVGADGPKFTWARGNVFERLDRVLLGEGWANMLESTHVSNLPRILSDHCPLLVEARLPGPRAKPSFRFQNMWVRYHLFLNEVDRCWREGTGTRGMINMQIKLNQLKSSLKIWNRVVFGNVFEGLKKAEVEAKEAMERYEQDPSPDLRSELNRSTANFILKLKMEEDYWRQKAALKWVAEGERNTKFFHGWVKQKRIKSRIHMIEDGDHILTEDKDIRDSAGNFFKNLLTGEVESLEEPDLGILESLPNHVNMEMLERTPFEDEIKQVVFSINAESAAGLDGYSALFFHVCWEIIKEDVVDAVREFFSGSQIPRGIAATLIVLIPKKKNPTRWAEFRPISLCNVINKIISKLLTSRMAPLLPILTVSNQSGFIRGRLLSDNVFLAKELFHEIWKGVVSPNMVLKLDMEKDYDRVQWPFLLKVLKKMSFSDKWVSFIENCISPCWFSVLINGSVAGFFKSSRGLRQGDPISPSLFILAADYLSRLLDRLILGRKEMMYRKMRYTMGISHLAYADDIIVFSQAQRASVLELVECLEHYMKVSGQKVNVGKSYFYLDKKHQSWAREVMEASGFQQRELPFLYLGVLIFRGPKKTSLFMFLQDKISARIHSWSHRNLSFGGRLTLIKSVLGALPIHIFQVLNPTKGALKQIEQVMARFLWGSCNTSRKTHWIKWQRVCLPIEEGGVGIRNLADVIEAFSIKMWWRFREQRSLWARYMHQKYCSKSFPLVTYRSNRFSLMWRRLFKVGSLCREQVRWVLGNGEISFWYDSWVLSTPLVEMCDPGVILAEEVGLPDRVIDKILQITFDGRSRDMGRWKLTGNGDFSLASAGNLVRDRERNENVHRDKAFDVANVIKRVNVKLRHLVVAKLLGPEHWKYCSPKLDEMLPQRAGGGGVLRDSEGDILATFAADLDAGSGLEAEAMALMIGERLAKKHSNRISIESDSETVVRWLHTGHLGPAEICNVLARVRKELEGCVWRISHIFREGNKVADFLAGRSMLFRWRCEIAGGGNDEQEVICWF